MSVFEGDGREIAFSDSVIVVRPSPALRPALRHVLKSFLESSIAHRLNNAKGPSMLRDAIRVSPSILHNFPVPVADKELEDAIDHLEEARTEFRRWAEETSKAMQAIVMETDASKSRSARSTGPSTFPRRQTGRRAGFPGPDSVYLSAGSSLAGDSIHGQRRSLEAAQHSPGE